MTPLTHKTIKGVAWNLLEQFAVRSITVAVTLLLAYFLTPEDFGLVAMMTVFINIATSLMDSGFGQALIQLPEARQEDFNTAFYANIVLSLLSYLLLFLAAPIIAAFYGDPRLVSLIHVTGLVVLINAFQVIQYASLSRELNFKAQFRAAFPASLISATVSVSLAYFGFGVWALIAQMITSALLITLFLWWQKIWRPTLGWSPGSLKIMYRFGYKLFLSGLLETAFKNMYVVVIAKFFTANLAGLYFFADRIREIVIYQAVFAIQRVTYPALATIQGEPARLKQGYKKLVLVASFILFPLILFLAAFTEPLFRIFLPEKWWLATIYVQLMFAAGLLVPIHAINLNVLQVMGRSDLFLRLEIIKKIITVAVLLISFRFGVVGILLGQVFVSIVAWVPNSYFTERLINYSIYEQLKDFSPSFLLAGAGAVIILFLQTQFDISNSMLFVIMLFLLVSFMYILVAKILKFKAYILISSVFLDFCSRNK